MKQFIATTHRSSQPLRVALVAAVLTMPVLLIGATPVDAQTYAPNPTLVSVTRSGNVVTVTFAIPTAAGLNEQLWDVYNSQSAALNSTGKLANVYTACYGTTSCTFTNLPAGPNYFQVATQVISSSSGLGCAPPAGEESQFPNGTGYCYSRVAELTVPSSSSSPTTTTRPTTTTAPEVSVTATGTLLTVSGTVYVTPIGSARTAVTQGTVMKIGDTLSTGPNGRVEVVLADNSVVQIGANSTFEIPEFVYKKAAHKKELWIDQVNGALRYFTGHGLVCKSLSEQGCWVDIQSRRNSAGITAVVGVRGTDVVLRASSSTNLLNADLHAGTATVRTYKGKSSKVVATRTVSAGTRIVISKKGALSSKRLSAAQWSSDLKAS